MNILAPTDGFGNRIGYCPKHKAGWYPITACPVCQGELDQMEAISERRKNLIVKLDAEQSILAMLLRECVELLSAHYIHEPGVNWLVERVERELHARRCQETGFMDGTGRCCLPDGHVGRHCVEGGKAEGRGI